MFSSAPVQGRGRFSIGVGAPAAQATLIVGFSVTRENKQLESLLFHGFAFIP